jgi:ADP-heptose:LPS heptosyltransferase
VINPIYFREPYLSDCLTWATGAVERIGQQGFQNPKVSSRELKREHIELETFAYTKLVLKDHRVSFEFYRNYSFFQQAVPGVRLPQNTRFTAIPVEIPTIDGPFAALLPGASESFREWPPERFAEVGRQLFLNHGLRPVIIGSQADSSKAQVIQQFIPEIPTLNLCGTMTLTQVVYLMSKCEIGITNDSGGIHLLAALNKFGVAVSNCNSFGFFSPYPKQISDKVSFVYPPAFYAMTLTWEERKELLGRKQKYFAIEEIPTEAVVARAGTLLRGIPHNDPIQAMCDENSLEDAMIVDRTNFHPSA